ncbi:Ninjurin-1 [Myotis brandtii]|uniref:Ninjurin-1 n=1 Tax=Myotis brandtii TaxID=109478 RepID=S7NPG7_MYOBR|nr:Ninjurin-1 [Myotis brandtii]
MDSDPNGYELNGNLRGDSAAAASMAVAVFAVDSDPKGYELNELNELNGNLNGDSPSAQTGALPKRPLNLNSYANKKSAAESMLDMALLMANASQLKAIISEGPGFHSFVPLVVLISISLVLQICVGVLLIFLVKADLNNPAKHAKMNFLNNLTTSLVFIIVVVNIFITAFGF